MKYLLLVLLALSGIVFVGTVMLMSPKGGLWVAFGGGAGSSNEYGSKKSLETSLKRTAYVTWVVFVVVSLVLPYLHE